MPVNKIFSYGVIGASIVALIVMLAVFASDYASAPAIVPTHFGVSGAPDAWGSKSTFVIFPVLGVLFTVLSVLVQVGIVPMSRSQRSVPPIVPILGSLVFAETLWVLVFAEMGSFDVALGRASGLSPGFFAAFAVVMLTAISIVIVTLLSARRST